ncbi:MAG: T9SS type A sorting domain-containing protein [Bacteroidetes bacterium]|nr:T9SS type A sorting domain-containing protein [Bacteroidota bacterium]
MKNVSMALLVSLFFLTYKKATSQTLPIGKNWGSVGAKWHYTACDLNRAKDSLVIVWEAIADTTISGKECHLFIKYYVDQKDKKATSNIDSVIMYNSITGDTFFRWIPRLSSWVIHYAQTLNEGDSFQLDGEGTPQTDDYLKYKIWNKGMSRYRFDFGKYTDSLYIYRLSNIDHSTTRQMVTFKGIGNLQYFKIEEGYDKYVKIFNEATCNLSCYQPSKGALEILFLPERKWLSVMSTGIEKTERLKNKKLEIYPNPTTGIFTIEQGKSNLGILNIRNIFGQVVYSSKMDSEQTIINIIDKPKGIYFVENFDTLTHEIKRSKLVLK